MKKVLICAALPRELKYILSSFREGRRRKLRSSAVSSFRSTSGEFFLLRTGLGIQNSDSSMRSLLRTLRPDLVVSLGFAGSVFEGLTVGDLVWASRVFLMSEEDANLTEVPVPTSRPLAGRLAGRISLYEGCIVTLNRFMRKPEIIKSLPEGLSFPVCDMETFALAKIAGEQAIPFFAVRAVTDTSEHEIPPELLDISCASGRTRLSVLLMRVLRKPGLSKDIIRLKQSSERAARNLASLLRAIIDDIEKENV
jgi:nucleoside phosphorylase